MSDKAITKTLSMPENIWQALDAHVKELHEDRSSFVRGLVTEALAASGKLPGTGKAALHAKLEELIAQEGEEAAAARLSNGGGAVCLSPMPFSNQPTQ
jgi:hypothetical protein